MDTPIDEAILPADGKLNDPADYIGDPDYLDKIELTPPDFDTGELPANIDTLTIKPRAFIIGGRLLRGAVSSIVGPPGVGKSNFEIATGVSIATGHPYLGEDIREQGKVWLFNNEEDREELLRRYLGFCHYHSIAPASLCEKLFLSSGYGDPLIVARKDPRTGEVYAVPRTVDDLIRYIKDRDISALSVDPIVSTHQTDENSNIDAEQVMSVWRHVAKEGNCAINLPAHISKMTRGAESDSFAGSMDAMRGASAVVGAARQVHTLARMGKDTAKDYGIDDEMRLSLVRLDAAKGNYSPPAENATWLQMRGQSLQNDPLRPDWIGVFTEYQGGMVKAKGQRDQNEIDAEKLLRLALQRLDLKRGQSVPVSEVQETLISTTKKGITTIRTQIPKFFPKHNSAEAENAEAEFTWEKKAKKGGGKKQLFIHREFYV
jgi:RecA-family ATPase